MAKTPSKVKAITKSPIDIIKEDKLLRKFLKRCKHGEFSVDTKKIIFDIDNLHRTRLSRNLKTDVVIQKFQTEVISAEIQTIAFRARIVEMKMTCFKILYELDKNLSIIKKYLKSEYAETMKKLYTTQVDRDSVIDTFLQTPIRKKKDLENVVAYADLVIRDIDAQGYNMNHIIDAVKLSVEKRQGI